MIILKALSEKRLSFETLWVKILPNVLLDNISSNLVVVKLFVNILASCWSLWVKGI